MGRPRNRKASPAAAPNNRIRIIGGAHRGRRLDFPAVAGLRPTGDRVRETLFNWLQPVLPGARCLDLFAGSGALGLEAASRGAGRVVMLDRSPEAAAQIGENIALLAMEGVEIHCADALEWLEGKPRPFDIVFLDPPFADSLLQECCGLLDRAGWLEPRARIYLEADAGKALPQLPSGWLPLRHKKAGQVCYHLYAR